MCTLFRLVDIKKHSFLTSCFFGLIRQLLQLLFTYFALWYQVWLLSSIFRVCLLVSSAVIVPSGVEVFMRCIHKTSFLPSHTNECLCRTGVQTAQPTHSKEHRLWPSGAVFRDKLWGSKEELQATAQFIKNIHLQIWHPYQHLNHWSKNKWIVHRCPRLKPRGRHVET